jgi:hypothetical protein
MNITLSDGIALGVLAIIFILTIIGQFQNKFVNDIRQKDLLNFLPAWYFFAPTPVTYNVFLVYRVAYEDGQSSVWQQVAFHEQRMWWHCIWNPKKRMNKAFFDLMKDLIDHIRLNRDEHFVAMSLPYLILLNFVSSREHPIAAAQVQFAIMRKESGETDHEVLFVSGYHGLEPHASRGVL